MKYILFFAAALLGAVYGETVAGLLAGAVLWLAVHHISWKERAGGRGEELAALRREVDDLRQRVAALEGVRPVQPGLGGGLPAGNAGREEASAPPPSVPQERPPVSLPAAAGELPASVSEHAVCTQENIPAAQEPSAPDSPPASALARMRGARERKHSDGSLQTASVSGHRDGAALAENDRPSENAGGDGAQYAANPLAAWFVRNPLLKAGVVVLFLGLAFLLRYASERVDVPVGLRYLGVAGAGLAAAFAGWRLQRRRREYGLVLEGFGIAVMYLTALAALKLHPLLPAPAVFAVMVGLVACAAVLAVKQDAQPMAQAALAGGLAAPLLVSDGSGQYLVLFSYLALLNAGVAFAAWFKAWRPLNLTGFAGTFLIAAAWGMRDYAPPLFASVEPFLLYHWLLYTLIAFLFARRRLSDRAEEGVPPLADNAALDEIAARIAAYGMRVHLLDHTLLFGTAVAAFALQWAMTVHLPYGAGWSALGFAAVYACAALLLRGREPLRVLRQAFAALALAFATLAVPLFFDGADTASLWTLEAVLFYYMGLRQRLPQLRLFALAVYLSAAVAQLWSYHWGAGLSDGLIQGSRTGTLLAAGGGMLPYVLWAHLRREAPAYWERVFQTASLAAALFYASLLPLLLFSSAKALITAYTLLALAWAVCRSRLGQAVFAVFSLLCALALPLTHLRQPFCCAAWVSRYGQTALPPVEAAHYLLLAALAAAAAWLLSQPQQRPARAAARAGSVVFLIALVLADTAWRGALRPSENAVMWLHPLLLLPPFVYAARRLCWRGAQRILLAAAFLFALRLAGEDFRAAPLAAWAVLAAQTVLMFWQLDGGKSGANGTSRRIPHAAALLLFALLWQQLVFQTASLRLDGVWLQLSRLAVPAAYLLLLQTGLPLFRRHPAVYRTFGGALCALAAAVWLVWANVSAPHPPAPLPYLPLLNPLEAAAAFVLWYGFRALTRTGWNGKARRRGFYALCSAAFLTISAGVMRLWHFYGGIAWNADALLHSLGVQAALSVVWAATAIVMMVSGNRSGSRLRWMAGAVLMGVVVVKLFLVELGGSGGIERIVSFIIVGLLLLIVGWAAPVPPRESERKNHG